MTKLKISMKWYVMGKFEFEFCDQQSTIYKEHLRVFKK